MFKLIKCEDTIRIPPDKFGQPLDKVAEGELKLKYVGVVSRELGYVIAITDVKVDPVGRIVAGDGATYHRATFTLLSFVPMLQEVLEGEVVEVEDFGAFVRIGPVDCLLHISQVLDDVVAYDRHQGALFGKRTQKRLAERDKIRVRVTAVSYGGVGGKIGVTARQPLLGKLEWIREELEKLAEVEKKLKAKR